MCMFIYVAAMLSRYKMMDIQYVITFFFPLISLPAAAEPAAG